MDRRGAAAVGPVGGEQLAGVVGIHIIPIQLDVLVDERALVAGKDLERFTLDLLVDTRKIRGSQPLLQSGAGTGAGQRARKFLLSKFDSTFRFGSCRHTTRG